MTISQGGGIEHTQKHTQGKISEAGVGSKLQESNQHEINKNEKKFELPLSQIRMETVLLGAFELENLSKKNIYVYTPCPPPTSHIGRVDIF